MIAAIMARRDENIARQAGEIDPSFRRAVAMMEFYIMRERFDQRLADEPLEPEVEPDDVESEVGDISDVSVD